MMDYKTILKKLDYVLTHNRSLSKENYYIIDEVKESIEKDYIETLKKDYLKYKKISLNKIDFKVFDRFENPLNEKEFKKLKLKALKKFLWYTGNHKEIFNNNFCFISSSCLHGFYFPNYESIYCIAFINRKAIIILNDTE